MAADAASHLFRKGVFMMAIHGKAILKKMEFSVQSFGATTFWQDTETDGNLQ